MPRPGFTDGTRYDTSHPSLHDIPDNASPLCWRRTYRWNYKAIERMQEY